MLERFWFLVPLPLQIGCISFGKFRRVLKDSSGLSRDRACCFPFFISDIRSLWCKEVCHQASFSPKAFILAWIVHTFTYIGLASESKTFIFVMRIQIRLQQTFFWFTIFITLTVLPCNKNIIKNSSLQRKIRRDSFKLSLKLPDNALVCP